MRFAVKIDIPMLLRGLKPRLSGPLFAEAKASAYLQTKPLCADGSASAALPTTRRRLTPVCCGVFLALALAVSASAQECVTQSKMASADRDAIAAGSRAILATALSGDVAEMKAKSAPDLAKDFAGVANALQQMRDAATGTATLHELYLLTAEKPVAGAQEATYLCGVYTPEDQVTFNLPGLKPGRYAVVFAHVTGTPDPRQVTLVLQDLSGWKLAGLLQKPLNQGGHDGLWYWQRAREMVRKQQDWGAYFCLQVARQLLSPADFVSSTNLDKLMAEANSARPAEWPLPDKPLFLKVEGVSVPVVSIAPALSIHNTPDLAAQVAYTPAAVAAASPQSQAANLIALQNAIGAELERKAPDFPGLVTQLLVSSTSANSPTTVVPVKRP